MRTLTQPLNMSPGGIPPVIHVSQYDSDFAIVFTLFSTVGDFTIENGTTAMVRGTKSSGTGYSADATINISAKTVTVTGNAQMTATAGQNVFEITLLKGNKEISSKNFILLCERAALDADTITDESVLKELNAIIESADTATQAAEDAAAAADRAEAAAQTLVIDSTPTQGSSNAVSSGGVYDALQSAGLSEDTKVALLACFEHVAWTDEHGQTYYNALRSALNYSNRRPELPDIYEQVEYIKSTREQYIVLNDILSAIPFNVSVKASVETNGTNTGGYLLSTLGTSTQRFYAVTYTNQKIAARIGNNNWLELGSITDAVVGEVYQIETDIVYASGGYAILSMEYDKAQNSTTLSAQSVSGVDNHALALFALDTNGSTKGSWTLYDIVIHSGQTKIFDGIPCYRKSDNKTGLFDAVNDRFYPNATTTEFVVGNVVE